MSRKMIAQSQEQGHNALRASLLAAAGISFERQAKLLQKAVDKLEQKLEAKQTQVISYQGDVTAQVELDDNAAQLRASEAIADLLGAKPSKQTGDTEGDVNITIVFPSACQPTVTLSTSQTPQQIVETTGITEPLLGEVNKSNEL